jgi:[protein-PII] uridylyltransferase
MDTVASLGLSSTFDPACLREELTSSWGEIRRPDQARAGVLRRLKALKAEAQSEAQELLEQTGDGRACAKALALFQDELVKLIYDLSTFHISRAPKPPAAMPMALVATGGYGRGLMAPGSDVDLLFLFPDKQTAQAESIVKSVLHYLWDLGYKVGHAVRTVDQTIKAAKEDMTIRTALLDARLIHGEDALFNRMQASLLSGVVQGNQREFIEAKLRERAERLIRIGFSRYMVEPNIKEGKGGLRDLNMLHWFAVHLNTGGQAQAETGLFSPNETATFNRCEAFLWTVRCYLHFLAGKPEERLSFDLQPEMARLLQYHSRLGLLGVERFMKHYFLIAKDVGDLTRTVCSCLEIRELKTVPSLSDFMGILPWGSRARLAATTAFRVDHDRLNVKQPDAFTKDPLNLIRLFVEAERRNLLLHPEAIRLIRSSLKLIDDGFRTNPAANQLFLKLLTSRHAPERSLRALNEAGVLGRFIADFGRVVAMAEFSMYHYYTIDEHTIRAVGILSQMEKGALADELPLATEIFPGVQNRRALYLALLMHDVAKAVEGDHSIVGAELTRRLAFRMGLEPAEADTAAWLVEHHLTMSQTAQSRDISDPQTVRTFADIVQSPERLKLLLLLTVADIRAVGPGVWNGWKGQLLRSLYYDTEPLLAGGHTREPRKSRIISAQARLRETLDGWPPAEIEHFIQRHEPDYWLKTDLERQLQHAKIIRAFESERPVVAFDAKCDEFRSLTELTLVTGVKGDPVQPLTELTLVTQDTPRLLMIFAGACAVAGANIASAQISTTRDGLALDTLFLQRLFSDSEEIERAQKISHTISAILSGKRAIDTLETARSLQKSRIRAFSVTPDIIIDNTASQELTVIEVHALDRPGLLFDLARGFSDLELDIASAHIATFGEKAVDVFYVRDRFRKKLMSGDVKRLIRKRLLALLKAG